MSMKSPMKILGDGIWRERIKVPVVSNLAKGFGGG